MLPRQRLHRRERASRPLEVLRQRRGGRLIGVEHNRRLEARDTAMTSALCKKFLACRCSSAFCRSRSRILAADASKADVKTSRPSAVHSKSRPCAADVDAGRERRV